MQARFENRAELLDVLEPALLEGSAAEWEGRLRPLGLAVGEVEELADALDSDLVAARGMVVSVETDDGPLRMVGSPIHLDDARPEYRLPPRLHEHTEEILGTTPKGEAGEDLSERTTR
jgi:CoA:oxalate CoA-transferase